jgi:uncharacterized protein YaaN involved in tellurite resistance
MSDSINIEKPALSEGLSNELDKTKAIYVEKPETAIARIPVSETERAQVKELVKEKMKSLEAVDIYSGDTEGITKAFADIFSRADANKAATAELANYFTKRNFRGAQDKTSFNAVTDLAAALQKYDPSKFNFTEPEGMMRFIPLPGAAKRGMANYMRSFKEAQGQIEQLMDGVAQVAEDGVKAKDELKIFDGKLLKLAKQLRVEYETFTEISQSVTEYLSDLKERDPMKADKVESELKYRVSEARLDSMTTLLQALNGSILVSSLVKTQDMIITGSQRASSSGRLILTINQTAAASANEQTNARELLEAVNTTIGNMTEGTSRLVLEHTKKMKELASSPLGQADKLKAAFQMSFQSLDELKNVQKEVSARMEQNIVGLEGVYKDATSRINAETQAVGAFKEIVAAGEGLAKLDAQAAEPTVERKAPKL